MEALPKVRRFVYCGIEKDELVQQVGRPLGFSRVGSNIQERIGAIVEAMLVEVLIRENGT